MAATIMRRRYHPIALFVDGGARFAAARRVMWKLGLGALLAVVSQAHADTVRLAELPGHVSEGRVVIDASPEEIYDVVTAYAQWPRVFSDIESVKVESGGREIARVAFRSRAIGREVTVEFENDPAHSISFRGVKGPPGGRASGHYALARIYMDVVGAPGLFVRDKAVREIRRAKLQADLSDIAAHFDRRAR